jgi:acyl carrier protein phosphodiesterase
VNYLAHIFLAEDTVESQLGNFLGDFLKGEDRNRFPEEVQRGIAAHLKVDVYTDQHPVFKQSRTRLRPERQRFAGIIVDIFYDHFLARNFSDYSAETLEDFSDRVITGFLGYTGYVPAKARFVLERINQNGRLASYQHLEAIDEVINGISRRFPRENTMAGSVDDLMRDYEGFKQDFLDFFPEVRRYFKTLS